LSSSLDARGQDQWDRPERTLRRGTAERVHGLYPLLLVPTYLAACPDLQMPSDTVTPRLARSRMTGISEAEITRRRSHPRYSSTRAKATSTKHYRISRRKNSGNTGTGSSKADLVPDARLPDVTSFAWG